jgi:glycogen(starch) synthase
LRVLAVGNIYPPHDFGGGYEYVWRSALSAVRARGHEVRVLCSDHRVADAGPELDADVHRSLRWYWTPAGFPRRSLRECLRIERHNAAVIDAAISEFRPDVVSFWAMGGLSMGLLERVRGRGVPAVAFVHDDWLVYGPRVDLWNRRWRRLPAAMRRWVSGRLGVPAGVDLGDAARYVFVSRFTEARARDAGIALADTGVAHSGIRDALLNGAEPPGAWGWRLLCLGRIDPRKGLGTAVGALAYLPEEARLTIVGTGTDADAAELRGQIAALGVEDRVVLAGYADRERIEAFYDEADAVAFPVTWEEPWGLVPLEAMARMRPVVATGRGGSAEYLVDGENCLIFRAGDAADLAAALERMATDVELRERLVRSGTGVAGAHTESAFNAAVLAELERAGG